MPNPTIWTLATIRNKIRDLTGSPQETQITDSELTDRINQYYSMTMPNELKVNIENRFYDFKTVPGQDIYDLEPGFFTDQPGVYADGFPCSFYSSPDVFYQDWPEQYAVDIIGSGNGIQTAFTGTLQNPPIIISSAFFTDGTDVLQSDSSGNLSNEGGTSTGTINYTTGVFSLTFAVAPSSSVEIYAKYIGFTGNRPSGFLWFQNQATLRPVPDQVYQMHLQGYIIPDTLTNDGDMPLQQEWGILIAYGVALDIFADRSDIGAYNEHYPIFKRYESLALSRSIQELSNQQSVPRF